MLRGFSAVGKLDLPAVLESWMTMAVEVINKAGNRLKSGRECQPTLLALQSLRECSIGARRLEEVNVDEAVNVLEKRWNEKVCCMCVCFLANTGI